MAITTNCKLPFYFLLIVVTACLASSVDFDGKFNRKSKQFPGLGGPLPYYAGFPVPIPAPAVSPFNKPAHRQSGFGGPTYVGVFPVLTGQQECPTCPEVPVCKNCTECEKCPVVEAAKITKYAKTTPELIDGDFFSAPSGTISLDVAAATAASNCYIPLVATFPNTKLTIKCTEKSSGIVLSLYNNIGEAMNADAKVGYDIPIDKEYSTLKSTLIVHGSVPKDVALKLECTWKSIP